jgi:hypothetical protein
MCKSGTELQWGKLLIVGVLFFLGCAMVPAAYAQEATIVGTVTDPSGAAVADAPVKITNIDTGIVRSIKTSSDGQYVAPDLHIGRFIVRVEASGFKIGERKDLILRVGDRARVDFTLAMGSAQETVTVEANTIAVQTDSGEVSGVITGQQITQLATNGRSIFALESLVPGASSIQSDFQVPPAINGALVLAVEVNQSAQPPVQRDVVLFELHANV